MRNSRNRLVMVTMALRDGIQGLPMATRATLGQTALALVSSAALVACDGADSSGSSRSESSVSAASTSSPDAAGTGEGEPTAVQAAYRRFWAVSWDVDKQEASRWRPALAEVSVDPELTRLYAGTKAHHAAGIRLYGQVLPRPSVVRLAGARALVRDCQDASGAGQADARSGARKTVGVARTPVSASLVRGRDGVWRVADVRYLGGSC